jgi:hypothetical protein
MNLSNENRLLLYCAQIKIPEDTLNKAEDILSLSLDWKEILESARWHGIVPLLYNNLKGLQESHFIPQEVMNELRAAYNANLARNMYIYAELNSILGAFREKKVGVIVLKGAALAKTVYGDIGLRPMSDVDLLVKKEDLPRAEKIMCGSGYLFQGNMSPEWYRKNHQHIVYIHPNKNILVEIHWHIANKSHPFRIRNIDIGLIERWWERANTVEISGKKVLILCPDDLIFHLCLHFLKHRFIGHKAVFGSKGALIQLCDIFQILKHYRDKINWARLKCEAEKYGVDSIIYTTLFIATETIGKHDDIFHDILNRFSPESLDEKIVRLINKRILDREDAFPAVPRTLIKSQVEDSFPEKVKVLLKQIFPHPEVLSKKYSVPMPSKRLYFCYLIHPLNLLLKSGRIVSEAPRIKEDVILRKWIGAKN